MKNHSYYILLFAVIMLLGSCAPNSSEQGDSPEATEATTPTGPIKVEIKKEGEKYVIYRGGELYSFNGAGFEFGDVTTLAKHGGTAFRTWRTDNGQKTGQEVLDEALENGLAVAMCIEVARERHGFDYDDEAAVQAQFEMAKGEVMKYKDHPALLMWIIGNELNLEYKNPKIYNAVNDISKMIHELDPNHPTSTTTAGIDKALCEVIMERAPDIDVLSVQAYADVINMPKYLKEGNWTKPYMITEWGATGHWEVAKTEWGAPIEQTSSEKADNYLMRYQKGIEPYGDQCIGSFVFLWGQKQERTPTWYGMFLDSGEETEPVDVLHYIWNGEWPENRSPRVEAVSLDGKTAYDNINLSPGETYPAMADISDSDGDEITYRWEIKPESTDLGHGGDFEETPETLAGLITDDSLKEITFKAPETEGGYRLFMYALDGNNHAAHANIPFYVKP